MGLKWMFFIGRIGRIGLIRLIGHLLVDLLTRRLVDFFTGKRFFGR